MILKCCEYEIPLMPQNNPQPYITPGRGTTRGVDVQATYRSSPFPRMDMEHNASTMHACLAGPAARLARLRGALIHTVVPCTLNTTTPAVSLSSKTPGGAGTHTGPVPGSNSLFSSTPWSTLDPHHKQTGNCDRPELNPSKKMLT